MGRAAGGSGWGVVVRRLFPIFGALACFVFSFSIMHWLEGQFFELFMCFRIPLAANSSTCLAACFSLTLLPPSASLGSAEVSFVQAARQLEDASPTGSPEILRSFSPFWA